MTDTPTVVVGLDGAHFELIDPWIDEGRLPNIESIMSEGVSSELDSVFPPVTSPNWKAYATGKNPGDLGIFWWENIDTDAHRIAYPNDRKHIHTEYWEYLSQKGEVGVVNVPTTYPPKSFDGLVVAGPPDGRNRGFTHPPELEAELQDEFGYRVTTRNRMKDDIETASEEIIDFIDMRFSVARYLLEEHDLDFLQVTTFYINVLQHFLWDDAYTRRAWEVIDANIGKLLEEDVNIVLMSDHGSTEIHTVFNVNYWLQTEGYLELKEGVSGHLHRFGLNQDRLVSLATKLGVRDAAEALVPQWVLNRIPDESGEFGRKSKAANIDWENSQAIASGHGLVYLIDDSPALVEKITEKLRSLTTTDGVPVATDVYVGEDVYHGAHVDDAPEIVIDVTDGVHIPGTIGSDEVFGDPDDERWRGENTMTGLFAAAGPDFTQGTIDEMSILDIAPTIMHLHDHSIPRDFDGDVRTELFDTSTEAARRDIRFKTVDKRVREEERIRTAVRDLEFQFK